MKVRIRKDKKTGETFADYGAEFNTEEYRYNLLKKIIESESPATLIIDSNQKTGGGSIQEAEEFIIQSGIKYSAFPVKQNNTKFFGFEIASKAVNQKIFVMELNGKQFSKDLYDTFLKWYDVAIGIGCLKPFETICDVLKIDLSEVIFNKTFFKESVYDSAVCRTLRSSFDIKQYIEAALNETAL